jgi:hypothetical protein
MLDSGPAASLKNVGKSYDVALDISVRVLQTVPNACLGRQMDYPIKPAVRK